MLPRLAEHVADAEPLQRISKKLDPILVVRLARRREANPFARHLLRERSDHPPVFGYLRQLGQRREAKKLRPIGVGE